MSHPTYCCADCGAVMPGPPYPSGHWHDCPTPGRYSAQTASSLTPPAPGAGGPPGGAIPPPTEADGRIDLDREYRIAAGAPYPHCPGGLAARDIAGLIRRCHAADKLQAFKDWVHNYLDSHGVPHHPPGTHGAEGCRIGDRMDWLMARLAAAESALRLARPVVLASLDSPRRFHAAGEDRATLAAIDAALAPEAP